MNTRIFQCNGLRRPLVLAVKTRGKNSAINSGSSIKIWYKFQILKGLPQTHDFHSDGEPLLHGPLFGSDPDGCDAVDAGDQNPIHTIDHLSLSSKGFLPANPVSTSCQY